MVAEDFPCPKCSHLNTTRSIACKNCGAHLKQASHNIKHIEKVSGRRSTLILNFIVVVAIFGIIMAVAVPKAFSYSPVSPLSNARGVGSALSSTITDKHDNYLKDGTDYTASDIVADTVLTGGIKATTGEPEDWHISAVTPTTIKLNLKTIVFSWDYIPRNGDTAAKIVESGDFGKAAETDSTLNLIITFVVLIGFIIVVSIPFYFKNPPFTHTSSTRADRRPDAGRLADRYAPVGWAPGSQS